MVMGFEAQPLSADEVTERIAALRTANAPTFRDRMRIRQIMNGGADAILALLGPTAAAKLDAQDLPIVNMFDSGITKVAQRLGRPPDAKVDPVNDQKTERKAARKREDILATLDYQSRMPSMLPWAGRWLPGYSFQPWVIQEGKGRNGVPYAKAEIRNPFDCFPGQWGPDQQPEEIAFVRVTSKRKLARQYPMYEAALERKSKSVSMGPFGFTGGGIWSAGRTAWEGQPGADAAMLGEYMDSSGTYLMALDEDVLLDWVPNPLDSGPAFSLARRPSFDVSKGQYDHYVGVMAMFAKLNILAYLASEDAVFRETNIVGDMISDKYRRGRKATNFFTPGTRVERPTADVAFQTFTQIDRIERHLRIGTNYSVVQDSESPNSFATGRALDKLTDSGSANITEYQDQLRFALEVIDSRRLEWEEKMYGGRKKPMQANVRGNAIVGDYRPTKDIAGHYETRRVYGVMAGWDEPEKIVTGLQLIQGEILDTETMQENLDGLENLPKINQRIRRRKTENRLYDVLSQRAAEGDPKAAMAMVDILSDPDKIDEILKTFYTPDEPEMSPEEAALAAAGGGDPADVVPPEPVTTTLSRILGGQADAGVQTVGRI